MISQDNLLAFARTYGADEHILGKTWETFRTTKENHQAVETLRAIEWFKVPGAFIHGPTGAGKSHAMKAMFNHALQWRVKVHEEGHHVTQKLFWVSMSFYLDDLRHDENRVKKKAISATALFIDDLGASTKTDWVLDQIFQLVDYRAERELQTFITSNWNLDELATNYSPRIASRISGLCVPVPMFCGDFRKQEMKRNTTTIAARMAAEKGKK